MQLEFGPYLPDLPALHHPGVTEAQNVLPLGTHYGPMPSPVVSSNALEGANQGACSMRESSGAAYTLAGDASKLYQLSRGVYTDVSRPGGYTTAATATWRFVSYGDQVLATNGSDPIQQKKLEEPVFTDLSAEAPRAWDMDVVKNFLVCVRTQDETDGAVPQRVRWPALGDITDWTVSGLTQADFQDVTGVGGWNQRIIGGDYGVIFQERALWRMTYVGSPLVFQFDEVERGRGTPAPGSVIKVGHGIYYLGLEGFYVFDGQQSIPIGANQVDRTFWQTVHESYLHRIQAVADPRSPLIYWGYPSVHSAQGQLDTLLVYNYAPTAQRRWSQIAGLPLESLFLFLAEGYRLEDLDTVSTSLDMLPFPLDSRVWTDQGAILAGFNQDHQQVTFEGPAMDATLTTPEAQLFAGRRGYVTRIRPLIEGTDATVTVQMGERDGLTEPVRWGSIKEMAITNDCPVRSQAFYHRARIHITGGFEKAQGLAVVQATPGGHR